MDLQQFRYVIALAEEGSFTRAAARCFVVQSALSHQIKKLEEEIGVKLFSRTSRRVEITSAGEAFLISARASLEAAEQAAVDAAASEGEVRGRLSIGTIPTVTAIDLAAVLRALIEKHPLVEINLQVEFSEQLELAILSGKIDIGFLGLPPERRPRGVASRALSADPLSVVMDKRHHLAGRHDGIRIGDLAEEAFVDFPTGTLARNQSDPAFTAAGIHRNVICESMATDITLELVRQNLAVTLLPSRYARRFPDLISLPIIDGPSRVEYVAWNDFNARPPARAFLDHIAHIGADGTTS